MEKKHSPSADIGLGIVSILVALMTIYGTLDLPPGSFEPLGSAAIPQFVAGGIVVFSVWIIARAIIAVRTQRAAMANTQNGVQSHDFALRHDFAIALVVLAVTYVAVMAMDWVRFSVATLVFLLASMGMLTGFARRSLPMVIVLAVVFGFGLEYLFTKVFVIDLP